MKDHDIIKNIRAGKREKPIRQLYKEYPKVRANILSTGGSEEIAQEIFNDSLILLIEKVSEPSFQLTSKLSTYLYGINRFLWKNQLRKQNRYIELEWSDTLIISEDDLDYQEEKEEKLKVMENILNTISEKCKKIFEMFYFNRQSMQFVAEKLGFSSVNSAKTQKYKCMERAIKLAKELSNTEKSRL